MPFFWSGFIGVPKFVVNVEGALSTNFCCAKFAIILILRILLEVLVLKED